MSEANNLETLKAEITQSQTFKAMESCFMSPTVTINGNHLYIKATPYSSAQADAGGKNFTNDNKLEVSFTAKTIEQYQQGIESTLLSLIAYVTTVKTDEGYGYVQYYQNLGTLLNTGKFQNVVNYLNAFNDPEINTFISYLPFLI